jgi:hypothetical protein
MNGNNTASRPARAFTFRIAIALSTALVACQARPPAAATGGAIKLRYGLKPTSAYDQHGTIALDLAIDSSTLPAGMAALAQAAMGNVRQEISVKGRLEVQAKAVDGSTPFTYKVVEATGNLVRGSETRPIAAVSSMVGRPPVEGRFSADGRRIEIAPGADAPGAHPDRARDQLAQSLPELPERDLRVGESFESKIPIILPGAGGRSEDRVEARWIYTLKAIEGGKARFDVRQELPKTTATASKGRSYSVEGGATGTATFDLGEGMFSDIKLDTDMAMTLSMPMPLGLAGPGGSAAGGTTPDGSSGASGATAPQNLNLGSKIRGPIAVTMSRAAAAKAP